MELHSGAVAAASGLVAAGAPPRPDEVGGATRPRNEYSDKFAAETRKYWNIHKTKKFDHVGYKCSRVILGAEFKRVSQFPVPQSFGFQVPQLSSSPVSSAATVAAARRGAAMAKSSEELPQFPSCQSQ